MTFNPYLEWLQLDAHLAQPSYYELLGIKRTELDSRVIAAAAERAASRVRSHRPGANAAAWADLLDEITAAKKCLLDAKSRQEYDAKISAAKTTRPTASVQSSSDVNLHPPGAVSQRVLNAKAARGVPNQRDDSRSIRANVGPNKSANSTDGKNPAPAIVDPLSPSTIDPQLPYSPMQPWVPTSDSSDPMAPVATNSASVPFLQPVTSAADPSDPMAPLVADAAKPQFSLAEHSSMQSAESQGFLQPAANEPIVAAVLSEKSLNDRSSGSRWMLRIVIGVGAGLVMLVVLLVIRRAVAPQSDEIAQQSNSRGEQNPVPLADEPSSAKPDAVESAQAVTVPIATGQQVLTPLADTKKVVPNTTEDHDTTENRSASKSSPAPVSANKESVSNREPESKPASQVSAPPEPKAMEAKPTIEAKAPSEPTPSDLTTEVPNPTVSKPELIKLGRAMQKTRDAIANHEFDLAGEFLTIAAKMPQLPEHTAKLDRLKLLRDAVKQYRQAIDQSVSKLEVGVTFDVNKTVVGVVEASRDKVVLRVNGRSMTYAIPDLPPALAAVLAEQSLAEKDPATIMMKGAFIISSLKATPADLNKARGFLEEASAENETAKTLLPILEDTYDLAKGSL